MQAFIHGVILALGLILPLGVQNIFVFNQGAAQRRFIMALPAVITASVCDTFLILLSVQGVSLLLLEFGFLKLALIGFGIVFLIYMGWLTWNAGAAKNRQETETWPLRRQVMFAASVSLLNPHAILDTIGVIGTSSVQYQNFDKLLFTGACILVSWLWFLGLALLGRFMGGQDWFVRHMAGVNKLSAVFMWGSAVYMLYMAQG